MTPSLQPGVLAPLAPVGRSTTYRMTHDGDPSRALARLARNFDPEWGVMGIGEPLARAFGVDIAGLHAFPALAGPGLVVPSTQGAVWICLRGDDPGMVFDRAEAVDACLLPAFSIADAQDTFRYRDGRDLTGYLDGTANPSPEESAEVAIVAEGAGLVGSSFASVQRWEHDLVRFRSHSAAQRDAMIGRAIADNEELDDAPQSAHVKRTAQETFQPMAFMVRRSMPWATATARGLEFVAYGRSIDPFERMLAHMIGEDDGIVDALFRFSRPVTGGHYWCPPRRADGLDLGLLGV